MQETFLTQKNIIIAVVGLFAVLGGGYYAYSTLNEGVIVVGDLDPTILNPELVAFINAKDKIKISTKDMNFLTSEFYPMLVDHTETINPSASRGRPDPFIPYAPTGPIR